MNTFIIHNGIKYYQKYKERGKGHYYHASHKVKGVEQSLHRRIWQETKGDIPKGMLVHHINENPEDNRIENLELMTRADHQSFHTKKLFSNPEYKKKNKEHMLKLVSSQEWKDKTATWRSSDEGRQALKDAAKKALATKYDNQHSCICKRCGKTFLSFRTNKPFCRDACRVAFKRKDQFTDKRNCLICGNEFLAHKWGHVQHCTRKCAAVSMIRNRPKKVS